jgi:hypothetical protein
VRSIGLPAIAGVRVFEGDAMTRGSTCVAKGVVAWNIVSPPDNDLEWTDSSLAILSALMDIASSGAGDGVTVGRGLTTCDVAKAAKTDAGTSETASPSEPRFPLDSMTNEDDAGASGVGEGVTVGRDMDACGVTRPAAAGPGALGTASLCKPVFGSIDLAASKGDAAASGASDGGTVGRGLGTSEIAKAAKTDADTSESASLIEPGFEALDSIANEDDAVASGIGEGVAVGTDMDSSGVAKPAVPGGDTSDPASPGKAPERGAMTAFGDPVASTISA